MPRDNAKISINFITANMCITVYYTYLSQVLSSFGFSPQQIGTLLMIYVLMAVVSMPLMGYLTDHFIPDKTMMVINLIISAISCVFFWNIEKTYMNMAIIIAVWSFSFKPVVNLVESYTYKLINAGDPVDYGVVRSMGSLGFGVTAYVMGVVIDNTSFRSLYYAQIIFTVISIFSILLFFRSIELKPRKPVLTSNDEKEEVKVEKKESTVKILIKNRDYVALILGGFFINIATALHFTYIPLLLEKNGVSPGKIGTAFSIMALAEIPTIAFFSKIKTRVNPSTLITIGGAVYILRMVAVVWQPTVEMFWIMSLFQVISFGFLSPSYMYIINSVVPREIASTATLTAITLIFNLSAVFSMYYGGYFIERFGYETVLSYGWMIGVIGTLIFLFNFQIIKNANRKAGI